MKEDKSSSSRPVETNERAAKRRKLHLRHRNEQLTHLWRVLIFSSITYSLGSLVIEHGWSSINIDQIQVKGSPKINSKTIVDASGQKFPQPLFEINPKKLETNLLQELPLKSISIRRRLIPPILEIEVLERQPIAFADRRGPGGKEKGMIDKAGYWMPLKMATSTTPPTKDVYVEGWMPSHRDWISTILNNQQKLGSPLQRIIVSPNGEISLKTQDFEEILLGGNKVYLKDQINALNQLSNNLPANFMNKKGTILDITDPSRPEFQVPKGSFETES